MIYVKTELGQRALRDRSVAITPRQRSAFIMLDGKHDIDDVLQSTAGIGVGPQDIDHLLRLGLIRPIAVAPEPSLEPPAPAPSPEELYLLAYPVANRLTAGLGLRGVRLNLAVERAGSYSELLGILPQIRDAVGPDKFRPLADIVSH